MPHTLFGILSPSKDKTDHTYVPCGLAAQSEQAHFSSILLLPILRHSKIFWPWHQPTNLMLKTDQILLPTYTRHAAHSDTIAACTECFIQSKICVQNASLEVARYVLV